jgi:hypothetical protein
MSSHRGTQLSIEDFRDLASIDSAQFQAALGFSVQLAARVGGAGTVLRLVDSALEVSIEFPWWDDPEGDLSTWTPEDIPIGTLDKPYFDTDQCWRILIWQMGGMVYIASGSSDEEGLYDTLLSVTSEKYRAAWGDVITSLKSL